MAQDSVLRRLSRVTLDENSIGRGTADAPDVDGVVYVTGKKLQAGQIVPSEIVATHGYDLVAAAVGKPR